MPELAPREISLIHEISQNRGIASQRELAQIAGISIGLINSLLKNLIRQGYVKTKNLNKKKIQYSLTKKGFKQNLNRCYQSVKKTIRRYQQLEYSIDALIEKNVREGHRHFKIVGEGELAGLVEKTLKKFGDRVTLIDTPADHQESNVMLIYIDGQAMKKNGRMMNLMEHLDIA